MTDKDELRVSKALQGLEFPATKATLLAYAEEREASAKTLRALESLPDRQYGNSDEVERAVPQRPEQELSD